MSSVASSVFGAVSTGVVVSSVLPATVSAFTSALFFPLGVLFFLAGIFFGSVFFEVVFFDSPPAALSALTSALFLPLGVFFLAGIFFGLVFEVVFFDSPPAALSAFVSAVALAVVAVAFSLGVCFARSKFTISADISSLLPKLSSDALSSRASKDLLAHSSVVFSTVSPENGSLPSITEATYSLRLNFLPRNVTLSPSSLKSDNAGVVSSDSDSAKAAVPSVLASCFKVS